MTLLDILPGKPELVALILVLSVIFYEEIYKAFKRLIKK